MSEPSESPDPLGDELETPGFDLRMIQKRIEERVAKPLAAGPLGGLSPRAEPEPEPHEDPLEEIAADLLAMLKRVKVVEESQTAMAARLESLDAALRESLRGQERELAMIRRDLLGQGSAMSARVTAEAVIPALERLRLLHAEASKNRRRNEAYANQVEAVVETLSGMLKALGFTPFEPALHSPFDPTTMRWAGDAKGQPGQVLGVLQPGYRVNDIVVRPASILLAPNTKPQ